MLFKRTTVFFNLLHILSVLLLHVTTVFAQERILEGQVSLTNGEAVSHATISIPKIRKRTMSNEKGKFAFRDIPWGTYTIEVQSLETRKQAFNIVVDASTKPIQLTVSPSSNIDLETVKVTGKTEKAEIETKGFAVNVIETQKAALQSIQTNELLDRSAGVRIRQDGGLGSHIHYNINGMTGNAVKIFIDGVPASNFGQSFSLNSIPPALIERIEVYKGVLPGYLSEDALGGAINVVMKQNKRNTLNTSYSVGSFNTHQFNANGGYRGKRGFTADASAFYNYSDNNYKVWGEEIAFNDYLGGVFRNQTARRFHDAYKSQGAKVDVGFSNVKWADRFTVGGLISEDYNEIQHGIVMYRVFGDRHSRRDAKVATLFYDKKDLLLNGLSLRVNASYSHQNVQVFDTVGLRYDWSGEPVWNPETQEYMRYSSGAELANQKTTEINSNKTFVVRTNLSYKINDKNILHASYLFNDFNRDVFDAFKPLGLQLLEDTRDLQKNVATFTYENLSFANKLRTNVFYKYYQQRVTSNVPYAINATQQEYGLNTTDKKNTYDGYGITFSYALFSQFYIMGSAERAIRFPNETEIFGNAADNLLPGNLEPEKSLNANIGLNLGAYSIGDHSLRLNTSVFYRDTKDMIRMGFAENSTGNSYYENLEDVLSRGVDAVLIYDYADKLNFTFNISKFDVLFNTQYNQRGEEFLYYRMQIRNEPSFKYNANIAYYHNDLFQKNSRASIYYNMGYVKGFLRNWANAGLYNLDRIPTQFYNDIGALYTFPSGKLSLSVDAKNIFNAQIFDNFGLQKPGRAFYTKITYAIL